MRSVCGEVSALFVARVSLCGGGGVADQGLYQDLEGPNRLHRTAIATTHTVTHETYRARNLLHLHLARHTTNLRAGVCEHTLANTYTHAMTHGTRPSTTSPQTTEPHSIPTPNTHPAALRPPSTRPRLSSILDPYVRSGDWSWLRSQTVHDRHHSSRGAELPWPALLSLLTVRNSDRGQKCGRGRGQWFGRGRAACRLCVRERRHGCRVDGEL